jgi:hypothetical protein
MVTRSNFCDYGSWGLLLREQVILPRIPFDPHDNQLANYQSQGKTNKVQTTSHGQQSQRNIGYKKEKVNT